MLIYVLDADPVARDELTAALAPLGDVHTGSNWSELYSDVIRVGQAQDVVLVCEAEIPGMSGVAFCQIVRRFVPRAVIVLYCARTPPQEAQQAVDGVVLKGEGLDALLKALERSCRTLHAKRRDRPSDTLRRIASTTSG